MNEVFLFGLETDESFDFFCVVIEFFFEFLDSLSVLNDGAFVVFSLIGCLLESVVYFVTLVLEFVVSLLGGGEVVVGIVEVDLETGEGSTK